MGSLLYNILRAYLPEKFAPFFKLMDATIIFVLVFIILPSIFWHGDSLGDYELMNESDISALESSLTYFSPDDLSVEDCIYNVSGEGYYSFIKDDVYFLFYPVTNGG